LYFQYNLACAATVRNITKKEKTEQTREETADYASGPGNRRLAFHNEAFFPTKYSTTYYGAFCKVVAGVANTFFDRADQESIDRFKEYYTFVDDRGAPVDVSCISIFVHV
jgi:hypothetical protein